MHEEKEAPWLKSVYNIEKRINLFPENLIKYLESSEAEFTSKAKMLCDKVISQDLAVVNTDCIPDEESEEYIWFSSEVADLRETVKYLQEYNETNMSMIEQYKTLKNETLSKLQLQKKQLRTIKLQMGQNKQNLEEENQLKLENIIDSRITTDFAGKISFHHYILPEKKIETVLNKDTKSKNTLCIEDNKSEHTFNKNHKKPSYTKSNAISKEQEEILKELTHVRKQTNDISEICKTIETKKSKDFAEQSSLESLFLKAINEARETPLHDWDPKAIGILESNLMLDMIFSELFPKSARKAELKAKYNK